MALERAALPLDILPNPLEVTTSLYVVLEGLGHRPVRAVQKISAVNIEPREADLLGVAEGSAGLSIELQLSTWDLRPFTDESDFLVAVLSRPESQPSDRRNVMDLGSSPSADR